MEETMLGSTGVQLLRRVAGGRGRGGSQEHTGRPPAAAIGALPGRGERPRDRHTRRCRDRDSRRYCDERGDRPAPEQKLLERPVGPMGALTSRRLLDVAEESSGVTAMVDTTADWAVA